MSNENTEKKRYSVFTTPIKNDFYAIHQPQHTPNGQENQQAMINNTFNSLKRVASEENTSSPSNIDCVKRMKTQPSIKSSDIKSQEQQLQLFNTCKNLWPENHTLGDFSYDSITELSSLLKIRLLQGKFKVMDGINQDNELYSLFAQDSIAPDHQNNPHKIVLSCKRTKSVLSVVGNRRNLPALSNTKSHEQHRNNSSPPNNEYHYDILLSPLRNQQPKKEKKTPKSAKTNRTNAKSPRTPLKSPRVSTKSPAKAPNTPRKKGITPDAPTIVLPDGKRFFLCEPCSKRYKNRNGLTYHLERCKNNGPFNREEDELQSQQSVYSQNTATTPMNENTPLNEGTPINEYTSNEHNMSMDENHTPINEAIMSQTTPTALLFEENKDEPILEEFDLFDSINSSFDEDMLSSLQDSSLGFSPQVDDLYNLF